jgi:hypothetical protein
MYSEIKYTADVLETSFNENDFLLFLSDHYSNENVIIENTLDPNSLPDHEISCIHTGTLEIHTGTLEKVSIPAGRDGYIVNFQYLEQVLYVAIKFPQQSEAVDPLSAAQPDPELILFVLPDFVFKINYLEESILNNLTRISGTDYKVEEKYETLYNCEATVSHYMMPGNENISEIEPKMIENIFLTMYYSLLINTPFFYGIIDDDDEDIIFFDNEITGIYNHNTFLYVIKKLCIITMELDETRNNNSRIIEEMQSIFREYNSFFVKLFFIHFSYLQHYNYWLGDYQTEVVSYMDVDHENTDGIHYYIEAQNVVALPVGFISSDHLYTNIYKYLYLIYNSTISQPQEGLGYQKYSTLARENDKTKNPKTKKSDGWGVQGRRKKTNEARKEARKEARASRRLSFDGGAIKKLRKTRKSKPKRSKTKNRKKKSKSKRKTKK